MARHEDSKAYKDIKARYEFYNKTYRARKDYLDKQAKAGRAFTAAVIKGEIVRQTVCSKCASTEAVQAHHEDYDKPLEVVWLCRKCHIERHVYLRSLHGGGVNSKYM